MLLPLSQTPRKFAWKWRFPVGLFMLGGVVFWAGTDRVPANATRPIAWTGLRLPDPVDPAGKPSQPKSGRSPRNVP